jgi:hypothetical protein
MSETNRARSGVNSYLQLTPGILAKIRADIAKRLPNYFAYTAACAKGRLVAAACREHDGTVRLRVLQAPNDSAYFDVIQPFADNCQLNTATARAKLSGKRRHASCAAQHQARALRGR